MLLVTYPRHPPEISSRVRRQYFELFRRQTDRQDRQTDRQTKAKTLSPWRR